MSLGASAAALPEGERARLSALALSYPVADGVPSGYRPFSRSAVVGQGRSAYEAVLAEVLRWQIQLRSGIAVEASDSPVLLGAVARLRIPVGPLRLVAYCRVVEVIDEPDRGGFAYGTLPGHPESGEESFVVSIDAKQRVTLTIAAFSRPAAWYARLGGPITRGIQAAMTRRYLRVLARPDSPAPRLFLARLPEAEVTRLQALDLTYPTGSGKPAGFWGYEMSAVIGRGQECFERAGTAVLAHAVFLRSGIGVACSSPTAVLGSVLRVRIPVGPLRFKGFSRVVEVVDESGRRGLAYGTLPGHPQSGREDLVVEIDGEGVVRLRVTAFSRPVAWYARLGRPIARALQLRMARRFLRVLAD